MKFLLQDLTGRGFNLPSANENHFIDNFIDPDDDVNEDGQLPKEWIEESEPEIGDEFVNIFRTFQITRTK